MEHLDLAGIMTTPPQWNTPVFDQQDAIYLSSSRQMLEPIMEETSEDEEYACNSWNQYDSQLSDSGGGGGGREDCDDGEEGEEELHESLCSAGNCGRNTSSFYSSAESDTGSVIRVEINKDNDSNSERDILCPAKRARRCEDPTSEDEVVLRRPHLMTYGEMKNNSLERFLNYENVARDSWGSGAQQLSQPQRNSLGNRRPPGGNGFDDFYSDSDSLSYNSLSRSSSLIQFESLERQLMLQEQHASMNSLGNSSPSLLSFDMSTTNSEDPSRNSLNSSNNSANNSRRGSQSSLLKKYESLDGRLHQTYYDLDKLNFDDMETGNEGENFVRSGLKLAELRSDSESSGSSSSSEASDGGSSRCPSVLSPRDLMEGEFSKKFQRSQSRKGKSSAENLSEDSGYCEPFGGGGLLRRSKSQNLCKNYEKFSEEDEELMEHKSLQQERAERKVGEAEAEAEDEVEAEKAKHSIEEFKNNTSLYQTPPTSPLLDYMRQQQRSLAHSPSPVSSEVSTVSSASSKNSATSSSSSLGVNSCSSSSSSSTTSSATTCASRASFTWLMPALRTTTPPPPLPPARASDCPENTLRISFDDLGERKTSNGKDQLNDGVVESGKTTTTTRTTSAVTTKTETTTTTICGDKENEHPKEGGSLARTQTPSDDVKELKIENFELEKRENRGVLETNFDFENNFEKIEQLSEEFQPKSLKKQLSCGKNFENSARNLRSPPPKIEDAFLLRKLQEQEKYLELNSGGFEVTENHTKSSEENWENSENQRPGKKLENSNSTLPENYLENNSSNSEILKSTLQEKYSKSSEENSKKNFKIESQETTPTNFGNSKSPLQENYFENFKKFSKLNSNNFGNFQNENFSKSSEKNLENFVKSNSKNFENFQIENFSKSSEKSFEKILKSEKYSNLHSQTCENLKTPPPCYTSESDYSPAADRRSFPNLMQNWPERTASVPTELNKLGRRKKLKKIRQKFPPSQRDSNSTESEEVEEETGTATNLKRSSSWCFESSPPAQDQEKQPLARLHRSYYNLTQLDLGAEKMAEKRISSSSGGDYETELVCKNNFLLDELSAHYDRTASILNDRPMSGEREVEMPSKLSDVVDCGPAPKPPARRRKSSNSSHSETEIEDPSEVQHVQLVIRKPPARQKRQPAHNEEKAHSLTQDFSFASLMQSGKTFDQDPTMLKTSYAQSLEKCNFDCREISNPDLSRSRTMPKRRFHSQANASKKKNLVSSTPNLNAYQKEGEGDQEFEDDLFVCSATNSMHQLNVNQAPKPLGILLPAGSRSSFGKEVSFCPVVSKYSWQEQSSEECHDEAEGEGELPASEESDDELLDNCDAVVLKNTKENEIIGSFYKECEEKTNKEYTTQEKTMQEKYKAVIKELPTLINKTGEDQKQLPHEEHKRNNGERERHTDSELLAQANVNNAMEEHKRNHTHSGDVAALRQTKQQSKDEQLPSSCEEQKRMELNSLPPQQPLAVAVVKTKQETSRLRPSGEHMAVGTQHENNGMEQGDNSVVITTATFSLTTNVNNETLSANKTDIKPELQNEKVQDAAETDSQAKTNQINCETKTIKPTIVIARPISIQLPILSEPPTNRAHHILYASQQMLDKFQRQQENETRQYSNKSQSVQNLSSKMSSAAESNNATISSSSSSTTKINNNNEIMKSKFKADEKHPNSKGFLSRFANGFRFSMRKNKKSKLNKEEQQQQPQMETKKSITAPVKSSNKISSSSSSKSAQPDYIYIPLKGPLPEKYETGFFESHQQKEQTNGNPTTTNGNAVTTNGSNGKLATVAKKGTKTSSKSEKVTGKPPLPPQQQQQQQQQATQKSQSANSNTPAVMGSSRFYTQELQQTADTANATPFAAPMAPLNPRGSTEDFLNAERGALSRQRHQSFGNNEQQHNMNYHDLDGSSPSRATVSQKTEMFNNLSRNGASGAAEPKIGLIETNLDTHETVITGKTRSLMNIGPNSSSSSGHNKRHTLGGGHHHGGGTGDDDDDDYDDNDEVVVRPDGTVVVIKNAGTTTTTSGGQAAQIASVRRPHKSMEFLLDKENQKDVMPPENELQKSHDHNPAALSEHQLRIQASLQRLNIPDWFRQYNQKSPDGTGPGTYKPGNFTRKRTQDSGRWAGLNSKTTSLSSLGSQRSDRSPLLLSPSAHSNHGGQTAGGHGHGTVGGGHAGVVSHGGAGGGAFSRWSTSHLNSSQTSPSVSQRGSFSRGGPINSSFISVNSGHSVIRNSMRQPYLGWRSQEKLSQRTAHERLASSLLSQQQRTSPTSQTTPTAASRKLQPVTPEIQSSIKEVTSAIVHYVNDQTNQQRSRSTSPNSRKCWLESSFVGIRPLDSPQTPVIESTPFIAAAAAAASNNLRPVLQNNNNSNNNSICNNSFHIANHQFADVAGNPAILTASAFLNSSAPLTGNDLQQLTRMNGGLNNGTTTSSSGGGGGLAHYHPVGGATVNDHKQYMTQKLQQQQQGQQQQQQDSNSTLLDISKEDQQRLRRRSEGDAPTKQQKQLQQLQQQQQQQHHQHQLEQKFQHQTPNANKAYASDTITTLTHTHTSATGGNAAANGSLSTFLPPRRVSLGDSSESNNRSAATANTASGELQVKCRNTKCDRTATPLDAKKYYKSCHNCTYLYCSRECRRAHWEKHRKACLHSRVSNLCRQVLASCKDDSDSLRHLSLLARKGFLSQGRGVVRILFRSPESAEGFIKNGFQCMGEASYVRWPDLMPAEMGLELYSELLKLSTEYRPDSKMLVYVAVCVVSEAPSVGQAPVRWERQLVSRCAKLKLCKSVLAELEHQPMGVLQQPVTMVAVPEPTTEVLILTFNPQLRNSTAQREMVLSNILDILSRRGVILRKHYPEIFQRFQSYTEGQTEKINPVTLHPRDSQTGQNFVCIIMPVQSDTEIIKLPSMADGGNRVTTIDVGSPTAISQLEDNEMLTRTSMAPNAS